MFCKGSWSEIFIPIISPVSFFLEEFLEQAENENGLGDGWGNKVIDELRNTIDIDEFEYKIDEMLTVFGREAVKHFCLLNVWKYRKRALYKNGEEDLKKADWYMKKLVELEGNENEN